jgi:TolB protein
VVFSLSCSDDPTAPPTSIRVNVSTNGGDLDEDGYEIVVDGGNPISVSTYASVLVPEVGGGTHVVELKGIAANCVSSNPLSQSVTVQPGGSAQVDFTLTCAATGMAVAIQTTGSDFPFGYQLQIADRAARRVPPNDTIQISRLEAGDYALSLTGIAPNCVVAGGSPSVVSVPARTMVPVALTVVCTRTEKRIAFVLDTLVGGRLTSWILTSDAVGSSVVPIVRGRDPSWAPDGRILFSSAVCDYYYGECTGGLEIIDPETREHSVLESGQAGVNPAWRPDGETFAFSKVTYVGTLYTAKMNAAPVRLDGPFTGQHPDWSPDGERIAFTCLPQWNRSDICTVRRDGSQYLQVSRDPRAWAWHARPTWSPDGSRIAFMTNTFNGLTDVALIAPDGTGMTRVTSGNDPAWSPDGSRLIFARDNGLYTIAPDGSAESRLTTGKHRSPAWRR